MATISQRRPPPVPADPKQHAHAVAEAVAAAWHGQYGSSRNEVAISVVAALAVAGRYRPPDTDMPQLVAHLDRAKFAELVKRIWLEWSIMRPDLVPRARMLWTCLDGDLDDAVLRAVHAVGQAALRRDVWQLGAEQDRRHEVDLLGTVLQAMTSAKAKQANGQFLTPECVTELMGRMAGPQPGRSVMDPAAGTGRMLLGAARAMREQGLEPADAEWWANDIDPLASALCAVNTDLWDLGFRVVVGCGDGLLTDWTGEALRQRQAAIDELLGYVRAARKEVAVRHLLGLPVPKDPLLQHLRAARLAPPRQAPPHSSTFNAASAYQGRLF
ncbi:N-6 DNA methylase [Actinoplanes sp. NPDC049316]|uniref:N-6 DNA methylase n=1 Tax=Actinoplanes sp. NPDC049316 TaxID=3154727 RepID=UPI00341DD153